MPRKNPSNGMLRGRIDEKVFTLSLNDERERTLERLNQISRGARTMRILPLRVKCFADVSASPLRNHTARTILPQPN